MGLLLRMFFYCTVTVVHSLSTAEEYRVCECLLVEADSEYTLEVIIN